MKWLFVFLLTGFHSLHGQQIKVSSGSFQTETPVEVRLEKPLNTAKQYVLRDASGRRTAAQLKDSLTLVFIPLKSIKSASAMTYNIEESPGKQARSNIKLQQKDNGYLVQISGKPVFFYHTKPAMPPADSPSYYQRSGFIHPLYSPAGQMLTDDFPVGHIHQHAIFSAWTNTTFRKTAVNFWNQHNQTGTVAHRRIVRVTDGPVFSEIVSELEYKSFQHGVVLTEQWRMIIYPFSNYFLFDIESLQQNVTADTLFLNPYHYGGMAFRGSREWNPDDKSNFTGNWHILTSEGMRDSSANQTAARWVDASGNVKGKPAGVAVFNHASNFRYPQKIRVHPQMPYWCYAPMIDGAFYIAPGQYYKSRFRYYVHNGLASTSLLDQLHQDWIRNQN